MAEAGKRTAKLSRGNRLKGYKGHRVIRLFLASLCIMLPSAAYASDAIALSSAIFVERPQDIAGAGNRITLEPLKTARSGDRLIYVLEYRNTGTQAVSDFIVSNPLPRAVRFDETINGQEIVSIDGGRNWGRLEQLRVTRANGTSRMAEPHDVTHLRWQMPKRLAGGETGRVTFRAIVR